MKLREIALIEARHVNVEVEARGAVETIDLTRIGRAYHRPQVENEGFGGMWIKIYDTVCELYLTNGVMVGKTLADKVARPCAQCYRKKEEK